MSEHAANAPAVRLPGIRQIGVACAVAAIWAIGSFFLVEWAVPDSGVVSVSFAILQPAAICAFIAIVGDPQQVKGRGWYLGIPPVTALGMILVSIFVLNEGAVCIAMLSPLWVGSGLAGTALARRWWQGGGQRGELANTFSAHGLLVVPLLMLGVEGTLPVPRDTYAVERDVVIDASPQDIWPLLEGVGEVDPDAGIITFSHSVLGLPRPAFAQLQGAGLGASREARWHEGVIFHEKITDWQPGERLGWQFDFANSDGWNNTDPHLHPDGPTMVIRDGYYAMEPLEDGRTRLRLVTRYDANTFFNFYAALWGEVFLGDIHANVLAVIRQRAEEG